MFARETMTLRKWYAKSLPIPNFDSKNYVPFLVGSVGIVRSILREQIGSRIAVRFRKVGTAHADFKQKEIVINSSFLSGKIGPDYPKLDSDEAISLILGMVVHEAAHFAYSPASLKPWVEYIEKYTTCPFIESVAATIGNTIEDIFIEAEIDRRVPTLSWLLDCTNSVFFSKLSLDKIRGKSLKVKSPPTTAEAVADVLNILIYAKTRKDIVSTPYVEKLFTLVRSATELGNINDRFALSLIIYNELMCNLKVEEEESGEGDECEKGEGSGGSVLVESEPKEGEESGEGDAGASESESGASESESKPGASEAKEKAPTKGEKALAKSKKMAEGITATSDKVTIPWTSTLESDIESKLSKLEDSKVVFESGATEDDSVLYVERTLEMDHPIEADSRYDRLAEIGRQRAVANRPYGMDRNRGNNIRKLYRIATDQKIFAEPVPMSTYKPMQVIILVDCSGSMSTYVSDSSGKYNHDETLISAATKAALGAAKGLADAHCDVAVYGHTACVTQDKDVFILKAKEFNEPVSVLPSRLGSLDRRSGLLRENKDGYAIRYISKKFTTSTKRRLLIVISDGVPCAPDYYGKEANEHTHQAVEDARKRGIGVLSISITESARRVNNMIYGEDNNTFNTDPNVIESIIRSLLLKG